MPPPLFRRRAPDPVPGGEGATRRADAETPPGADRRVTHTIPVVREEAHVEKQLIDRGSVRVVTQLEDRIERVDVPIVTEDAVVERVAINRPVPAGDLPRIREEGDTLVIPVLDEEVVVERRYVLREEVRITRNRRVHPRTQDVLLQGQRVVVERHDAAGRRIPDEASADAVEPAGAAGGRAAPFPAHQEKQR